jgi:hypothetical protein
MRNERQLLNADNHFGRVAKFLEETRGRCGTLQTADALEIEGRGKLNGMTDLRFRRGLAPDGWNASVADLLVNRGEIFSKHRIFETEKLVISLADHSHVIAPSLDGAVRVIRLLGWY